MLRLSRILSLQPPVETVPRVAIKESGASVLLRCLLRAAELSQLALARRLIGKFRWGALGLVESHTSSSQSFEETLRRMRQPVRNQKGVRYNSQDEATGEPSPRGASEVA